MKIKQHSKEEKANIQPILYVCIYNYTTENKILSQIKTKMSIKLYQTTILAAVSYGSES